MRGAALVKIGVVCLSVLAASCHGSDVSMPAGQVAPSGSVGTDAGEQRPDAGQNAAVDAGRDAMEPRPADAGAGAVDPDPIAPGFPSGACAPSPGLRLMAPLSGSTMTTAHPRLQLEPGPAAAVDVQICRDRACGQVVWQQTVAGRDVTPPELAPGYWFWRARATGSTAHDAWTSAWLFRIRARAPGYAPLADTVAERFDDFNGDGIPDAVAQIGGGLIVYFGGPSALPPQVIVAPDASSTIVQVMSASGVDLNGDGFTDFATLQIQGNHQPFGVVQLGDRSGLVRSPSEVVLGPAPYPLRVDGSGTGVGDVDGDGYGDLTWFRRYGGLVIHGCATGVAPGPWVYLPCDECEPLFTGDLDGDGRSDLLYGDSGTGTSIYLGGASPVSTYLSGFITDFVFDVNQDGYADLVARATSGKSGPQLFAGGPAGISTAAPAPFPSPSFAPADFDGDGSWDAFDPSSVTSGATSAIIDFNGDGYDDLVAAVRDGGLLFYAGSPDGLSAQPVMIPAP